jgi:hypothetical protein
VQDSGKPNIVTQSHHAVRCGVDVPDDLADWNNVVPMGREFGSPDYDRLTALDDLAVRATGSLQQARRWLEAPHPSLRGRTPEEVAKSEIGYKQVIALLTRR